MKSILYAGATLMIGASIYGFVDYKQTSQQKEFTSMYEEKKTKPSNVIEVTKVTEPAVKPAVSKEVVTKKNRTVNKKKIVVEQKPTAFIEVAPEPAEEIVVVKKAKKKKLDHRIFSRAPLREYEKEDLPPVAKTSEKKIELKQK